MKHVLCARKSVSVFVCWWILRLSTCKRSRNIFLKNHKCLHLEFRIITVMMTISCKCSVGLRIDLRNKHSVHVILF